MKKIVLLMGLIAGMGAALFAQEAALPRLAVVGFSTNVNTDKAKADAVTVRNLVENQMVETHRYRMMTRNEIDKLLENQEIQVSSISSEENLTKLELEQINYIITGSLDAMGDDYSVTVRVLDISIGKYPHSVNDLMGGDGRDLYDGIKELMTKFNAGLTVERDMVNRIDPNKIYKVGDTGPAGGIVFFDKGIVTDGWRYLEAAPTDLSFGVRWGAYKKEVDGTETGIGTGRRNTQLIVDFLREISESGTAAQRCTQLNISGFNDWFLPSVDELSQMYSNLVQNGLGSFSREALYWSSSQTSNGNVWIMRFSDGGVTVAGENSSLAVRAVRAF